MNSSPRLEKNFMPTAPFALLSRSARLGAIVVAAVTMTACATSRNAPKAELATAESAVERATAAPAVATTAAVEMQSARDKLARAQRAMDNKDYDEARRYAEQAEVDARLAESKAAATQSQQALRELQESIRALNTEIDRRSTAPAPLLRAAPVSAPVPARVSPAAPLVPVAPPPPMTPRR
jgi:hypothetical protein